MLTHMETLTTSEQHHQPLDIPRDLRAALDDHGFALVPEFLSTRQVQTYRAVVERLFRLEGPEAGREVRQERGAARLQDLINKDTAFDELIVNPLMVGAAQHVLRGPVRLTALHARDPHPGEGGQGLHADWAPSRLDEAFKLLGFVILLDDYTRHNGATRVVPGTHRVPIPAQTAEQVWSKDASAGDATFDIDLWAPHPREIVIEATAGAMLLYNGAVWHSGTKNVSGERRRTLQGGYVRRHDSQWLNQREYLRPETRTRLSAYARYILDVD
jgi:ectoine hydroxylase-related dioxygenase (phytanoyl-CoA dioxygenase family)